MAFIDRACTALHQVNAVALRAPLDRDALAHACEARLAALMLTRPLRVHLRSGEPLCPALGELLCTARAAPAALFASAELSHAALIVTSDGSCGDEDTDGFLRLAKRRGRDDAPRVLWIADTIPAVLDDGERRDVRGLFDPLDAMAYVAALPRWGHPLQGRLVASVAVETAGWDVGLMDRLTALPIEVAVRPDLHVEAWDDGRVAQWRGATADWTAGNLDDWGGLPLAHPCWMAGNEPAALTKRVWRGQLAALLPWIEQQRLAVIDGRRRALRSALGRSDSEIDLLDWGPLAIAVRALEPSLAPLLEAFRTVRNELAHGRPVDWARAAVCLSGAPRLLMAGSKRL